MYIYIIQKINNNIRSLGIILKLGEKKERICINLLINAILRAILISLSPDLINFELIAHNSQGIRS